MSFTEEVQRLGHDPATRVVTARTVAADAAVAEALDIAIGASVVHLERLRMADGEPLLLEQVFLSEARFPGPARRRPRGRLAVRAARRALRHARRPGAGVARAHRPPAAGGPAARRRASPAGAAHRRPGLRPLGAAGRVRALVRPGRPDALLRGAGRRPLQPPIRRHRWRRRGRRDRGGPPTTLGIRRRSAARVRRRSRCEPPEPSPPSPCWRWSPARAAAARRPPPRRRARRRSAIRGRVPGGRPSDGASAPANTPIAIGGSTPAPGQTEIRWYCCLGGGDAPEQVDGREAGRRGVQRQPPGHPRDVRGGPVRRRQRRARDRDRVGQRPRHRRAGRHRRRQRVPRPVARPRAADRRRTTTTCRASRRTRSTSTSSTRARSASRSRSTRRCCSTRRACSTRPASPYPPHKYGDKYTMPDGSQVDWNYDTITKVAKILTVDKNGKDATQAGFDPDQHRPVGLRAPARRPARHGRLLRRRARWPAADGKTAQIPDAWKAAWKFWYDCDVDGPRRA